MRRGTRLDRTAGARYARLAEAVVYLVGSNLAGMSGLDAALESLVREKPALEEAPAFRFVRIRRLLAGDATLARTLLGRIVEPIPPVPRPNRREAFYVTLHALLDTSRTTCDATGPDERRAIARHLVDGLDDEEWAAAEKDVLGGMSDADDGWPVAAMHLRRYAKRLRDKNDADRTEVGDLIETACTG